LANLFGKLMTSAGESSTAPVGPSPVGLVSEQPARKAMAPAAAMPANRGRSSVVPLLVDGGGRERGVSCLPSRARRGVAVDAYQMGWKWPTLGGWRRRR